MMFGMWFFWIGIILLVALAIRGGWGVRANQHDPAPSGSEILEERFAKGEIAEDEFRERRRVLAGR